MLWMPMGICRDQRTYTNEMWVESDRRSLIVPLEIQRKENEEVVLQDYRVVSRVAEQRA